jgi:dynein light chain 1
MTTCSAALKAWAEEQKEAPEDAKVVKLYAQMPPISKLDNKLNDLKNVVHLSLSTNCIDRINVALALPKIRILSMGRNNLKKIEKLDGCSSTL